jgi:hypothetical protein
VVLVLIVDLATLYIWQPVLYNELPLPRNESVFTLLPVHIAARQGVNYKPEAYFEGNHL